MLFQISVMDGKILKLTNMKLPLAKIKAAMCKNFDLNEEKT